VSLPSLPRDRAAKHRTEERELALYALKAEHSRGRQYPDEPDPLRTEFERDRDRLVHSSAFRRLMYKSQVFVNRLGDHHRTRLSHSLEVAQVARSVASALRLNESLCEALALAHDIGHPPFGHRGEWALDGLMAGHGGFRHNAQVLRVVDLLERRSPAHPGLNLTRELRESLLKHEKAEDWPAEFGPKPRHPYLEAQVVDLADSTAYDMHDIEDGLRAKMFGEADLEAHSSLWREARERTLQAYPGFLEQSADQALKIKRISNELIKATIEDLIQHSAENILRVAPQDPEPARHLEEMLIGHSPTLKPKVAELQQFLFRFFYRHEYLQRMTRWASELMQTLFEQYLKAPHQIAPWYRTWSQSVGLHRAICDYLAGMTDRFAEAEYQRLTGRDLAFPALPSQ
jgi:dGTPase